MSIGTRTSLGFASLFVSQVFTSQFRRPQRRAATGAGIPGRRRSNQQSNQLSNRRAAKHPGRRGFRRVGERANRSPLSFRVHFAIGESMHSALPRDPFSGGLSGDSDTGLFPTADRALPAFRGPRRLSRSKPMKTTLSRVCSGSHEPVYQRFHGARQRVWERSAGPIGAQIWTRYLACR